MNVEAPQTELAPGAIADAPLGVERFLAAWVEAVNDYLQRQYREIIQQEASPEKLWQYRSECKWLLRTALSLDSMVKDPEYPASHFGPEVAGKLLQLRESWQSLNNPVTGVEADAILGKVFPDEPRVGSPA